MGTPYKSYRANRRSRKPVNNETECRYETGDRRKIFCDGRLQVPLCGSTRMVLSPHERSPPNETRNCSATNRIQHVERDNSTVIHQVPCSTDDDAVFLRGGSPEPGIETCLLGVQSLSIRRKVFFDTDNITVFTPTDWTPMDYSDAHKGEWTQIACDRFRFLRRIEVTELLLRNILSVEHRERFIE